MRRWTDGTADVLSRLFFRNIWNEHQSIQPIDFQGAGFAMLLGVVIFLSFGTYDDARTHLELEVTAGTFLVAPGAHQLLTKPPSAPTRSGLSYAAHPGGYGVGAGGTVRALMASMRVTNPPVGSSFAYRSYTGCTASRIAANCGDVAVPK